METTPTSYAPLDESQDEIRLITISPYAGESSLVRCNLETVSLRSFTAEYRDFKLANSTSTNRRKPLIDWRLSHPNSEELKSNSHGMGKYVPSRSGCRYIWGDYAALSYAWGDRRDSHRIIINGVETRVGQNLEAALRALSKQPSFQDRYKLWVDAICINQKDTQERDCQIGKMRKFYGDALAVISWLGEEKDDSDSAFRLIHALADASKEGCGKELEQKFRKQPDLLGNGCWLALHELMDRTYWCRLWIIQEVVLGCSSLVLRCGDTFIDWTTFCQGIGFLQDYLWMVKDDLLARDVHMKSLQEEKSLAWYTTSLHLVYQDLWGLSQIEESGSGDWLSFGRLLDMANAADCQDARDKVYGLVGMMDPVIAANLTPDYRLAPSEVYARVAKTYICTFGNLDPIREGNIWSYIGTPSWAADWTFPGRLRYTRPVTEPWGPFWGQKGTPPKYKAALPYNASGQEPMKASFDETGLRLTCRGFIIDEIAGLTARERGYHDWAAHSIVQPKQRNSAYGDTEEIKKALYHALVADRVAGGGKADERHSAILSLPPTFPEGMKQFKRLGWTWLSTQEGYYFRWSIWRQRNQHFRLMGKPLNEYFENTIPDDASEYTYTEVYNCFDRTCKGRRFMTTAGGYLGWAPDNMFGNNEEQVREGDLIVILFGCSTPIVIRPHGDFFHVLGEAYVQGLMEGEALEFLDTGQCEARDFIFC